MSRSSRRRFLIQSAGAAGLLGVASWTLAVAGGPEGRDRDRKVLEAVIADEMDPKNPLNENYLVYLKRTGRKFGKVVVVDARTRSLKERADDQLYLKSFEDGGEIPKGHLADLKLRNKEGPFPLKDLGIADERVQLDDLDTLLTGPSSLSSKKSPLEEKYPNNRGYLRFYLPGYSADGKTSVVLMDHGPSPHGIVDLYYLGESKGVWKVKGRWRQIYE
ncbi:hypothetical protein [Paludisphaera mucosa]|uniref:Uncharacterized protein n=1 Tax=Paludisphaera mucosa TaxID=3030827 RepID=A0ABT6FKY1_9BACT|nr:hypothetical protein [Paludisphaera mucosa]MDG3008207.1 hypothetical protein [Paludisphaera mucosa]